MNLIQSVPLRTALLGGGEGLNPLEIFGGSLVGWWDVGDQATVTTNAGGISQVDDKSGNGNDMTANSGREPANTADGLNGKHVATFDQSGTNQVLGIVNNTSIDLDEFTFFAVFRNTSLTNFRHMYGKMDAAATIGWDIGQWNNRQQNRFTCNTAFATNQNTNVENSLITGEWHFVIGVIHADGNRRIRVNGIIDQSDTYTPNGGVSNSAADLSIGARMLTGSSESDMEAAEWGLINRAASIGEMQALERHLQRQWNVVTPASILGEDLVAWFDSSDTDTITDVGGFVSQWDDKSKTGADVSQGTAGRRPAVPATQFAGIEFDGSDDVLEGPSEPDNIFTGGGRVYAVVRRDGAGGGGFGRIIEKGGPAGWFFRNPSANNLQFSTAVTGTDGNWQISVTNDKYIVDLSYDADSILNDAKISLDGIVQALTTDTNPDSTLDDSTRNLAVGGAAGATRAWDGAIFEIILSDAAMSAAQDAALINYLKDKWSIT